MISVKNIKIIANHVLVKVDEHFDTFQVRGIETGLIAPGYVYEKDNRIARPNTNYSVTGEVYGVPGKIKFNRDKINRLNKSQTIVNLAKDGQQKVVDGCMLRHINDLKNESCNFETDNELQVGDRIKFSYFVHVSAKEKGAIFDTEEGKMYFIKYDMVCMTVNPDNTPKKMVNGYILVDPETIDTKKEGALEYSEAGHGIVIPKMYEVSKHKRGKKCMEGSVVLAAQPLTVTCDGTKRMGGYFEIADYFEKDMEVNSGDKLLFDPRVALQIEHDNHQSMFDHRLYIIQRKDIIFMENQNDFFEEIGLNKVNYELRYI